MDFLIGCVLLGENSTNSNIQSPHLEYILPAGVWLRLDGKKENSFQANEHCISLVGPLKDLYCRGEPRLVRGEKLCYHHELLIDIYKPQEPLHQFARRKSGPIRHSIHLGRRWWQLFLSNNESQESDGSSAEIIFLKSTKSLFSLCADGVVYWHTLTYIVACDSVSSHHTFYKN